MRFKVAFCFKMMNHSRKLANISILMYSASVASDHGGHPKPTQDDDQELAKLKKGRESHRGQREERGEQD